MTSIRKMSQMGGMILLAVLATAIAFGAYQVNKVRFGGTLHHNNQQIADLIADILPPPQFIIEPYLEVVLLANNPSELAQHRARLNELKTTFEQRRAYWAASPLPPELKANLVEHTDASAEDFWGTLEGQFLPAIAQGDQAGARAAYAKLTKVYNQHRKDVEGLVAQATKEQAELSDTSASTVAWTMGTLGTLALAIVGIILYGIRQLDVRAITPLAKTANAVQRMAGGDYEVRLEGAERTDEIGALVKAVEVLRVAAKAQAENEVAQRQVVSVLASGLEELAAGNMAHRITAPLPPEYEALRDSFNSTLGLLDDLMARVASSAASVHTGASEIRAASDDLAARTEQQAASLEETSAAMNQVTGMVQETATSSVGAHRSCQTAFKRDPRSASKRDPLFR